MPFYAHGSGKEFSGLRWTQPGAAHRGEEHSPCPIAIEKKIFGGI